MRDLSEEAAAEAEAEDGSCGCGRPGLSMTMADWRQSRRGRSGRFGFGESEGWMDRRVATGSSLLGQTKTKRGAVDSAVVAVPTATGHSRADWWVRCGRRPPASPPPVDALPCEILEHFLERTQLLFREVSTFLSFPLIS